MTSISSFPKFGLDPTSSSFILKLKVCSNNQVAAPQVLLEVVVEATAVAVAVSGYKDVGAGAAVVDGENLFWNISCRGRCCCLATRNRLVLLLNVKNTGADGAEVEVVMEMGVKLVEFPYISNDTMRDATTRKWIKE